MKFLIAIFLLMGIGWFIIQYIREKRSLKLGISFIVAASEVIIIVALLLLRYEDAPYVRNILVIGAILIIIVLLLFPFGLIFFLITTGIQLIRREGLAFSHLLSFGFGIAYIFYLIGWPMLNNTPKSAFFDFLYAFLSFVFYFTLLTLMFYTITSGLNLIKVPWKKYQHIVVLGSGLKNGEEVTPLLAGRVDKGIEAYQQNKGSKLVLSGGQGPDEKIPEGEAMKNYALSQGVPESAILVENQSINTKENLLFSEKIIKEDSKNIGNLLVVTTSYHVLRALLLAKNLGIPCDGRGARTKLYFSINAFIREWIAYLVMWRKTYIRVLIAAFVISALSYLGPWLLEIL